MLFQAQCRELRRSLVAAARQELAELEARAVGGAEADEPEAETQNEAKETERMQREDRLTRGAFESAVAAARSRNVAAFNLQHVASVLPTPAAVTRDVFSELERLRRKRKHFTQASLDGTLRRYAFLTSLS